MTQQIVTEQQNQGRDKLDRNEVLEWIATFRDLITGCEAYLAAEDAHDEIEQGIQAGQLTSAFFSVAGGLAMIAIALAPHRKGELASSFLVFSGAVGVRSDAPAPRPFEPISVSVLSTESRRNETTGNVVDVSMLRVQFNDPTGHADPIGDALVVRRDRAPDDDRRVVYFKAEPGALHFDRAAELRLEWLGVSGGPFVGQLNPCTSS